MAGDDYAARVQFQVGELNTAVVNVLAASLNETRLPTSS